MSARRVAAIAALVVVLIVGVGVAVAACGPTQAPASVEVDGHDCDADDLAEGDPDCFGKRKASKKPTPRSSRTAKPRTKPRRT